MLLTAAGCCGSDGYTGGVEAPPAAAAVATETTPPPLAETEATPSPVPVTPAPLDLAVKMLAEAELTDAVLTRATAYYGVTLSVD